MRNVGALIGYVRDVKEGIKDSTRGMNEAITGLTGKIPETAKRVISHGVDERVSLNAWASTAIKDCERLIDPKDRFEENQ